MEANRNWISRRNSYSWLTNAQLSNNTDYCLRLPHCSITDCVYIRFVECKPKLPHGHNNWSCQLVNSIAHNMGCADNCSTEVSTVKSQKTPWSTDSYVTMLTDVISWHSAVSPQYRCHVVPWHSAVSPSTDAMLSLDILQYHPSTNCTYFEGPLKYNSMTLHTISGPSMQFKNLKCNFRTLYGISEPYTQFQDINCNFKTQTCNFRTLQQVSMLLIVSVENRERYGCVMVCSGIIIIVWLKSARTFEILTRNAHAQRNKGSHRSFLLLNLQLKQCSTEPYG